MGEILLHNSWFKVIWAHMVLMDGNSTVFQPAVLKENEKTQVQLPGSQSQASSSAEQAINMGFEFLTNGNHRAIRPLLGPPERYFLILVGFRIPSPGLVSKGWCCPGIIRLFPAWKHEG